MKTALIFALTLPLGAANLLEQRIEETLRTARALAPGAVGIEVVQLRSGKVLYTRNAEKLFTPASNTKLFSTALALNRLGRDYRLKTRVYVEAGPDTEGRVAGDLTLFGGGDPSMADIVIPYDKQAKPADAMAAIEELADQIAAKGVKEIRGDVVGDDTTWPYEPTPPGWAADDALYDYGAPVVALTLNHGKFQLTVSPGAAPGEAARLTLTPAVEYFAISNRVTTVAEKGPRKVTVERPAGSRELRISGTVAAGADYTEDLAVDDPALYAAVALADALARRGVAIHGSAVARHRETGEPGREPAGRVIAERVSPPLVELLRVVDKVSQNLWAEMMLREVARARTGEGSRRAGLEELRAFLSELGAAKEDYVLEDGSGLSRLDLLSPAVITRLLRWMALSPQGADFKSLLPVGGVDGSLEKRFKGMEGASAIAAKTGSLSHVNALSGYAESATYGELVFSIVVNHTSAQSSAVRAAIDRIAIALLD